MRYQVEEEARRVLGVSRVMDPRDGAPSGLLESRALAL